MRPKTPLPPFWWDVVRRNPGRITVLVLIFVGEIRKVTTGEPPKKGGGEAA